MTIAERLRELDDADTLTVRTIRRWLAEQQEPVIARYVPLARASEIIGCEPRRLRRLCARWERALLRGERPDVRVARKSGAPASDWLLDEDDCWALRRASGAVVAVENDEEADAIADRIFREGMGLA